jgi:hypothetical protein
MEGLIKEGHVLVKAEGNPDVGDAGLVGEAQRIKNHPQALFLTHTTGPQAPCEHCVNLEKYHGHHPLNHFDLVVSRRIANLAL